MIYLSISARPPRAVAQFVPSGACDARALTDVSEFINGRARLRINLLTAMRREGSMEVPAGYQLQLFGHALARGSCTVLSARSGWSLTERALRSSPLALGGLNEVHQGLQEC